ncbi:MAG TPA: glycine cleavage system aminomethyltransferase GcvT [Fimbriimonadaceae bacterium]|nr:glycine cleavage system aminomethyltransferase GcvT [Fimbriimonadaceae bacterium]
MNSAVLRTPLHAAHVRAGGKMVEFAGYEMPVQYAGIIAETKAVREHVGMFDVSHMARLTFTGPHTLEFLEWITTNDVSKLVDRTGQYSLLPNPDGGCVDDIIVYRISGEEFRMVVNAANHAKDVTWIRSRNTFEVAIEDTTDRTSMIAVQGPQALATLSALSPDGAALAAAPAFGVVETTFGGVGCFAARSGYTGEDGFELICANADAERLWDALLAAGVAPCGLGSRDALRVEAGLPLYGHELGDTMSPIAAGLGWVVSKTKSFIGSEPIQAAREQGTPTKLQGVRLDSKRLPMIGMKVFVEGREVGEVSSGVFSPTLECGIAFAFLASDVAQGTPCGLEIRGKLEPGTVVNKRFLKKPKSA